MAAPAQMVADFAAQCPGLWDYCAAARTRRGQAPIPDWPDWCYVPQTIIESCVDGLLKHNGFWGNMFEWGALRIKGGAFAAWRMGRGVYRFDADLAAALAQTDAPETLPAELLLRLPEWGVWLEGAECLKPFEGAFCWLNYLLSSETPELRIWFVNGTSGLFPSYPDYVPVTAFLPLDCATLRESLTCFLERTESAIPPQWSIGEVTPDSMRRYIPIDAAINLLLYLCSSDPDYEGTERPKNPTPVKTKRGEKLFPSTTPRVWRIGERIGGRLRQAAQTRQQPEERNAPRPHLRRAHWHTFRIGTKRRGFRVRWLHPILVGDWGTDEGSEMGN